AVDRRATGVARADVGVDLDQAGQRLGTTGQRVVGRHRLTQRGDAAILDAGRPAGTAGVTQRHHRIADPHRVGVADVGHRKATAGELEYGDVVLAVEP